MTPPPTIAAGDAPPAMRAAGVMLDIDGCLVLSDRPGGEGGRALPGAAELVGALRGSGLPFVVFTNGSARSPRTIGEELRSLGIDVSDDQILTPAVVAASVLSRRHPGRTVMAFGEGVTGVLASAGIELVDLDDAIRTGPRDVAAVVVGWDTEFGSAKIRIAAEALRAGAALYCTSDAPAFASPGRLNVGVSGFIAAGLQHVSGIRYELLGKPAATAMAEISQRLGVAAADVLVVGDDLHLECRMARSHGAQTALVTTGMTDRATAESAPPAERPHWIIDSLYDLATLLEH